MKTIAELLNHDFEKGSLCLYDFNGNQIYFENSNEYWYKREYDSNSNLIYSENSYGNIEDHRPKESCEGKVDEWVEEIYTNELQNTNGRETPDEMFKKGIRAAIENTLTDKGLREAAEEYLNVVNNAMSFDNMVEYHKTAKAARYEMQKALNQNK